MKNVMLRLAIAGTIFLSGALHAQDTSLYYKLGGARPVSGSASLAYNYHIGVNLYAGGGFSCGKFDLKNSVKQVLNSVKQGAEEFQQAMVTAAQSAVASLPALMLQRLNPGLYDIFQNALLAAKADVNLQVASCRQMENDISNGNNPYKNWIRWGRWSSWQRKGAESPDDINTVGEDVREHGGEDGVPWICSDGGDYAGGVNQLPIRPVRDAVIAGYNILLGRTGSGSNYEVCSLAPAPTGTGDAQAGDAAMREAFRTPEDAAEYAVQVLGDTAIYTYEDAPKTQSPGTGVLPYIQRETIQIATELFSIVQGPSLPDAQTRALVSAPYVVISNSMLNAFKSMDPASRQSTIRRLAAEVAASRHADKLLWIRRMLLAARDLSQVRNAPPAIDALREAIEEVRLQTDEMTYEVRTRHELVSNTALELLQQEGAQRSRSPGIESDPVPSRLQGGAPNR